MRISDWSSDVCSSDLRSPTALAAASGRSPHHPRRAECALRSVARRTAPRTYGNPWKAQKRCPCPRAGPECTPRKYLVLFPVVLSSTYRHWPMSQVENTEPHYLDSLYFQERSWNCLRLWP